MRAADPPSPHADFSNTLIPTAARRVPGPARRERGPCVFTAVSNAPSQCGVEGTVGSELTELPELLGCWAAGRGVRRGDGVAQWSRGGR